MRTAAPRSLVRAAQRAGLALRIDSAQLPGKTRRETDQGVRSRGKAGCVIDGEIPLRLAPTHGQSVSLDIWRNPAAGP